MKRCRLLPLIASVVLVFVLTPLSALALPDAVTSSEADDPVIAAENSNNLSAQNGDDHNPIPNFTPVANTVSGTWGSCQWTLNPAGTLTIGKGTGVKAPLVNSQMWSPWNEYRTSIKRVVFDSNGGKVILPEKCDSLFAFNQGDGSGSLYGVASSAIESIDFTGADWSNVKTCVSMFPSNCALTSVTGIDSSTTGNVRNASTMFDGCISLESFNVPYFIHSEAIELYGMFNGCTSLETVDVTGWNVTNVTNMSEMFNHCESLTDVTGSAALHAAKLQDAMEMFADCHSLGSIDLTSFKPAKATSMVFMFYNCRKLKTVTLPFGSIAGDGSDSYVALRGMFTGCELLESVDLSGWTSVKSRNTRSMFSGCSKLAEIDFGSLDLRDLSVSNGYSGASNMFEGCSKLSKLTLGTNFRFGSAGINDCALSPTPAEDGYLWRSASSALSTDQLMQQFNTNSTVMSGTWVWSDTAAVADIDITGAKVELTQSSYIYDGKAKQPSVKSVTLGNGTVVPSANYAVSYQSGRVNAGTYTVAVTGKDGYTGSASASFTIDRASLKGAKVTLAKTSYTYDGAQHKPVVTSVKLAGTSAEVPASGYSVSYSGDCTAVGTYTVTVAGKGNYRDSAAATFKVVKKTDRFSLASHTWGFRNMSVGNDGSVARIPLATYTKVLGPALGYSYYAQCPEWNGLCYGYVSTSQAIAAEGLPAVSSFGGASRLSDVPYTRSSNSLGMSALDYIKLGFVAQWDPWLYSEMILSGRVNDYSAFVAAVRDAEGSGEPVCTGIFPDSKHGGHAIWAMRVIADTKDETSILAYDCNAPGKECTIHVYKNPQGSYSGWGFDGSISWGTRKDPTARITWATPADRMKALLDRDGNQYDYDKEWADAQEYWSKTKYDRVFKVSGTVGVVSSGTRYELSPGAESPQIYHVRSLDDSSASGASGDCEYYLADIGDEVGFTGITQETTVGMMSFSEGVDVSVPASSEVIMNVSDGRPNEVRVFAEGGGTLADGETVSVSYCHGDEKAEAGVSVLSMTGKAAGPVTVSQSGDVYLVSGVSEVTVDNGVSEPKSFTGLSGDSGTYTLVAQNDKGEPELRSSDSTPVPMYRLYNPNSGEHFYTAAQDEHDNLVSLGWNDEGVGWTAPEGGTPVYRLYNANGGEHHYTTDAAEKDMLVGAGWSYEGVGWYSAPDSGVPLYRDYNPNAFSNNHNYTADKSEHDYLVSIGWNDEGIAWYGV